MRTSFNQQPEAQPPNLPARRTGEPQYPICSPSGFVVASRWNSSSSPNTIATSVARPELIVATAPAPSARCWASSRSAIASESAGRCAQNTCGEFASQESGALFDHRTSSTVAFIDTSISWPDGFLSKDRFRRAPRRTKWRPSPGAASSWRKPWLASAKAMAPKHDRHFCVRQLLPSNSASCRLQIA